ncbi:MAG: hypothetical protein COV85_02005 [Candidatus Portnoybacteria bacterium CG11_big_fil_rev_8_21_14_0_20_44_10]|uniref:histidine kinase n=2 Tax=Candidatus Portnoyibacteriota TaxID=1817913 RepID=A0A2H0KQK0_9BACT|nr:MAG: hypothetical protein COV85_02005 [Candidatus Portnoybacteria bacterium CG11_big_fil_rev_8_21_14_0_20_44_10]
MIFEPNNSTDIISLIPLASAGFVFILGIFVFLSNWRATLNRIFFFYSISITIWFFGTYKMFFACENAETAMFWDRFIYIGVIFIPSISYHFSIAFANLRRQRKFVFLGYLISIVFLFFIKNPLFTDKLFVYKWGCHTIAGPLHNVFLVLFFVGIIALFANIYIKIKQAKEKIEKIQARYAFTALLILSFGALGFLPAYKIAIFPIAYFSGLICAIILAYAILRHHLFEIRVIAAELLTFATWFVLLIRLLLENNWQNRIIDGMLLVLIIFFGLLLIRSVIKEIEQKDNLEKLTLKLEAANERLKQLDEAKSEFLSIASHQLRTPLTTIKGVTSMLLEEFWGKLNEEQKKHLDQIYQSEERLLKLVEDLLDITRIEAGRMQFNFKPTSLEELIDGQIKELRPMAVKKSLYLHFIKFKSPLPKVLVDAHKIEQVIQNLIDNAIKYTDAGEITITLEPTDDHLLFSIKDTGSGITKSIQPFLFEKFQRGPRATTHYTEGAGLGLYWAGKVIRAHNGKIWVESEGENEGSVFYFTLPIIKEA